MVEIVLPDNMDLPDFFFGCCIFLDLTLSFYFFIVVVVVVVVVVDVVAVSAVLRMGDSWTTTFGSRCFNKSMIFRLRFVSDFRGLFCTVV